MPQEARDLALDFFKRRRVSGETAGIEFENEGGVASWFHTEPTYYFDIVDQEHREDFIHPLNAFLAHDELKELFRSRNVSAHIEEREDNRRYRVYFYQKTSKRRRLR